MPWTRTGRPTAYDSIDPGIAGVVAPIGAGTGDPDPVDLVLRQAQRAGDPSRAKWGFCEPVHKVTPSARASTMAQPGHAGVRLERPFVFSFP
jgi:hypothetical protein